MNKTTSGSAFSNTMAPRQCPEAGHCSQPSDGSERPGLHRDSHQLRTNLYSGDRVQHLQSRTHLTSIVFPHLKLKVKMKAFPFPSFSLSLLPTCLIRCLYSFEIKLFSFAPNKHLPWRNLQAREGGIYLCSTCKTCFLELRGGGLGW